MEIFNSNSLVTNEDGRVSFSGFSSGIDFQSAVDSIMEARRIPVDRLETQVEENTARIAAFNELSTRLTALKDAVDALRGAVSVDSSRDIFEAKQAFTSARREDTTSPSQALELLSTNISNAATPGNHSVEILQIAKAHKVGSSSFADTTSALGFSGTFELNGVAVDVNATDSLLDLRDRINAANVGDNASGVSASIVSASGSENVLVLTADDTGQEIDFAETAGTPLQDLGILAENRLVSDGVADSTKPLSTYVSAGTGTLDITADDGTLEQVNYDTTADSLDDIAASIDATGVANAKVVTEDGVSSLEITSADGKSLTLADSGALAGDLNIRHDAADELQAAQDARIKADGLSDDSAYSSDGLANDTDLLSSFSGIASATGTLTLTASDGSVETVAYDTDSQSLADLASDIDATGVASAQVVTEDGTSRLEITSADGEKLTVSDDGTLRDDLGLRNQDLVITRDTNTIDDLFQGITLDLFKAEEGTTVDIEVERDLNAVKEAVGDFVNAFNDVKQYINAQRQNAELEGQSEDTVGVLSTNRTLADIEQRLSGLLAQGASNVTGDLQVLAQIGIDFVDNGGLSDSTLNDTLEIDDAALNDALLAEADEVRELFSFGFSADSSNVTLLNFSGGTQPGNQDYTLDVTRLADGTIDAAATTINGVAGSLEVNGDRLVATDKTGAEGLELLYTGGIGSETITFDVSTGIASNAYFSVDRMLDETEGVIESEIDALRQRNDDAEQRIDRLNERLDFQREELLEQFIRMEEALATLERVRNSVTQITQALQGQNS